MYVQVVSVDGKRKTVLNVSKLTTIRDLKRDIAKEFAIKIEQQSLFFRGKHLEDDGTLYDYRVDINNVIQVMIKSERATADDTCSVMVEKQPSSKTENNGQEEEGVEFKGDTTVAEHKKAVEEAIATTSKCYKVGDAVDCTDKSLGSWFEARILQIFMKSGQLLYKVKWDFPNWRDNKPPFDVDETSIRPRAHKALNFNDLDIGQTVMLNYNLEKPSDIGYWYDFTIRKIKNVKSSKQLVGTIHLGNANLSVENCTVNTKLEIYEVERPKPVADRNEDLFSPQSARNNHRVYPVKCTTCSDDPDVECRECSCLKCGQKNDPHLTLLCDECDVAYHIGCLNPPLTELPNEDDDWYCPDCKVNASEILKKGDKFVPRQKRRSNVGSNRDWGKGMACVGRTKICNIVPVNHRGHIPGIEVGTMWKFRLQVSEAGVHRPHVAGIHGRADDCAYSIVLSGGYKDDIDNGEEFIYTGSGGRDLSGNKRIAKQSSDQQLTLMNRALAMNSNSKINDKEGVEAADWKQGVPIRVVRNYKLAKHRMKNRTTKTSTSVQPATKAQIYARSQDFLRHKKYVANCRIFHANFATASLNSWKILIGILEIATMLMIQYLEINA